MPSRARKLRIRWIQACSSSAERALASDSIGCGWRTFSSSDTGSAADPLGGRVGGDQLGVLGLERAQLVEQRVVLVVADLGVVERVVAVVVVVDLLAQLGGALLGGTVRAAWLSSRSSSLGGGLDQAREVVALERRQPLAVGEVEVDRRDRDPSLRSTAARSVPVSSRSKLASP